MPVEHCLDTSEWNLNHEDSFNFGSDTRAWRGCVFDRGVSTSNWRAPKAKILYLRGLHDIGLGAAIVTTHHPYVRCHWATPAHDGLREPIARHPSTELLRRRFEDLAAWWRRDTQFSSSLEEKVLHPAYQTIMTLGMAAVPLVLESLKQHRGHWFWALRFMTGADPVPEGANVNQARDAWLEWGRQKGLLE
ncbi:MAG TPA: hypothetical protein VEF06_11710 [Bryobacteraceae bacterium]|nr:hypothetical protein [Bryobacteraceae bacterium]